ncbi:MAG: right-handed parallel beta-helix repeat-containing protein [Puniceicoccaceae bacterium]
MSLSPVISVGPDTLHQQLEAAVDGAILELQGGDYFLQQPIRITGKHSLTIRAAEGARVNLYGGQQLTEWTEAGDGVWKTGIGGISCELYADGVRQQLARWPKEAPEADERIYCKSTGTTPTETRKRAFKIEPADFPTLEDGDELTAFLWPSGPTGEYNWHSVHLPCRLNGNVVELSKDTWFDLGRGTRFYLLDHPSLLTAEGEFHIDREKMEIHYMPEGGSPEGKQVILPLMKNIIEIRESSGIVIEGITLAYTDRQEFIDGEVFDQDEAAVFITDNSSNITVRNCTVHHTGLNGITMYRRAQRVTVENCHIHNIGHTGVRAYGDWVSEAYMNKEHLVLNNHIHHLGERVGQCAGVQLLQSGDCTIANNLIHHSSRYAISLISPNTPSFIREAFFPKEDYVPSFKARWYTYVRNNLVYRNEVYDCCRDSQDTGLIQGFRSGEGNVVSDNIVRDSEVPFSFGNGIYLDDCCDGWTVKNNLVYNLNHHGGGKLYNVLTLKGIGNVAENNRFINNKVEVSGVISTFSGGTKENYNLVARLNIFHENQSAMIGNADWQPARFRESNRNLVYESSGNYYIRGGLGLESDIPFYKWQRAGFDTESRIRKAQFTDEEACDFRLKYTSPAWALGVAEINYGKIGLGESYTREHGQGEQRRIQRLFAEVSSDDEDASGDLLEGNSWLSRRSGESLVLKWYGRCGKLLMHRGLSPSLSLTEGDPSGIEIKDGHIKLLRKGVYSIKAEIGDAVSTLDFLVDEVVTAIRWASIPEKVVLGEKYATGLVGTTDLGREFALDAERISINAGARLIRGDLFFTDAGLARITVQACGQAWELETEVCLDRVKDLVPELRKIAILGQAHPVKLLAIMNSGRQLHVDDFAVEGDDFVHEGDVLQFSKVGEQKLTFRYEGVISEFYIRVIPSAQLPDGYEISQYGKEEGTALTAEDGTIEFYSNGNNVWWKADDATFLRKEMPSEKLQVEMVIHSVEAPHRDAQSGIMVRASDSADSRNIHFRTTADGELMVAVRKEDGIQTLPVLGASPWAKFGANEGGKTELDDRVADGVAFPVHLKLTCTGGVFSFYFKQEGTWDKLGEVALDMPETCLVGASYIAVDINHAGMSRFTLDCKTVS